MDPNLRQIKDDETRIFENRSSQTMEVFARPFVTTEILSLGDMAALDDPWYRNIQIAHPFPQPLIHKRQCFQA